MSIKLLTIRFFIVSFALFAISSATAQDTISTLLPDSLIVQPDSLVLQNDSIRIDTNAAPQVALDAKVDYVATDSIRFDVKKQMVYLYNNADIDYEEINLKAAEVQINFATNIVEANGIYDTLGNLVGRPEFTENGQVYKSNTMKYNFETKKGYINSVFTEDGEGYLHGSAVKKMPDESINVSQGSYTTCNDESHPHFGFHYNKAKVIPGKKIITGPAYLVIEDVPTPLFIPFGIFPNKQGQRSGILIPSYGESASRGFFLENGGYYWAVNDYLDLKLVGDIYTRGSWALKPTMNYRLRYKFQGNLALTYAINKVGTEGSSDYSRSRDFAVRWSHSQDPKARPNSRFSANVNIVSSNYNKYNPTSTTDYLSNTFQSSISYQTNWSGKYFLTLNASHSQNTKSKVVTMTLPEMTFKVNRFYPLRKKTKSGSLKWYDNISIDYTLNSKNTVSVADSLFFTPEMNQYFQNGIKHSIPISSPLKVLKYFNLTNSVRFTNRNYFEALDKSWSNDTIWENDTTYYIEGEIVDTVGGFYNAFDYNFSSNLTTKLYGMVQFKKGPLRAIRHVVTPTVGFSYTPDFGDQKWGYWDSYVDGDGEEVRYSKFENGIYGRPPSDRSGRVNFSISNNLEIKVPSKKDTINGTKKIALIDNFSLSTSYDLAKDSLNWSNLRLSGRTRLAKGLDVTYSSEWDPYIVDSTGRKNLNQFEWNVNKKLFRHDKTSWNLGLNLSLNDKTFKPKESEKGTDQELDDINQNPDDYVDWTIPWRLNIAYNFRYTVQDDYAWSPYTGRVDYERNREKILVQTLSLSGELSLTKKWKVNFRTGYDFENSKISYTSVSVYRDLHCWQMRFNWIPMGPQKSWNFTINAKSSILQDLKLDRKKDFRDNF